MNIGDKVTYITEDYNDRKIRVRGYVTHLLADDMCNISDTMRFIEKDFYDIKFAYYVKQSDLKLGW
jgi:hypothetical protein